VNVIARSILSGAMFFVAESKDAVLSEAEGTLAVTGHR